MPSNSSVATAGRHTTARTLAGRPRTTALTVVPPPAETDQHPAYAPLYEATCYVGGSIASARALVAEFWDEASQGPLPDERTVQRWARADQWDGRWLREIQERGEKQTALVNVALQGLQLLAIRAARDILLEEGNPKFATAKRGVFRDVMFLTGVGIMGARYGPIDTDAGADPDDPDDAHADAHLTTDELLARQAGEYRQTRGVSSGA